MPTTRSTPPIPSTPPGFDKVSFLKYVKDIGRPYRKRAVELVSICRLFVQAQDQAPDSYYDLRSALQLVDDALMSATEAGKKTSKQADKAFKDAASELGKYEIKYHPKNLKTVAERIEMAEKADKSSLKTLNSLMEKFRPLKKEPTMPVEFLLHKSLPDRRPTVITQELCRSSHLNEILWNFSRPKEKERRLTLKQNPHFYEALPTSRKNYGGKFEKAPIESSLNYLDMGRISVLTDKLSEAGRVFLKTAKKTRAFGNVWDLTNAIIFKDVCGKLEGESIVAADIQDTPNLWCITESPPSHTSPSSPSSNRSSPSPTTTATPTSPTSSTELLSTHWKEPIRQMLRSESHVNIRISTKPPINSIPSSPASSSSIPQSVFSSSLDSLQPTNTPQSRLPISELPQAELSPGPPIRPSAELPARLSAEPPARPSPEPPAHPTREPPARSSREPPFKLSSQPTAVPAHSSSVPLSMSLPPQPPSVASPLTSSVTPARTTRPPLQHVQTDLPAAPQTQGRRRNWFQKYVYDYATGK